MSTYQLTAFLEPDDPAPEVVVQHVSFQIEPLVVITIAGINVHVRGSFTEQADRMEELSVQCSRRIIELRSLALDEADRKRRNAVDDRNPVEP